MLSYPDTIEWGDWTPADTVTPSELERAVALAWTTLYTLTGQRLALAPVTVRPVGRRWHYSNRMFGHVVGGGSSDVWQTCPMGMRDHAVALPGEVGGIVSVSIDGDILDPADYRVDNGNLLVRQDGETWPIQSDLDLPAGAYGTFIVTYWEGVAPSSPINYAAGVLAQEFLAALDDEAECRLPSGVTTIVRQGVTMEIGQLFANGQTGIQEVDAVVRWLNPYGLRTRPVIASPDSLRSRTTTIG